MTWTCTTLSTVVLVIGMHNIAKCWSGVEKISVIILTVYAFVAWPDTTLHGVVLVIGMYYVANGSGVV